MYPHFCLIDYSCNNYRMQPGRGRILPQGRACAPRGYLPARGFCDRTGTHCAGSVMLGALAAVGHLFS
jgi:hypothetical protein